MTDDASKSNKTAAKTKFKNFENNIYCIIILKF